MEHEKNIPFPQVIEMVADTELEFIAIDEKTARGVAAVWTNYSSDQEGFTAHMEAVAETAQRRLADGINTPTQIERLQGWAHIGISTSVALRYAESYSQRMGELQTEQFVRAAVLSLPVVFETFEGLDDWTEEDFELRLEHHLPLIAVGLIEKQKPPQPVESNAEETGAVIELQAAEASDDQTDVSDLPVEEMVAAWDIGATDSSLHEHGQSAEVIEVPVAPIDAAQQRQLAEDDAAVIPPRVKHHSALVVTAEKGYTEEPLPPEVIQQMTREQVEQFRMVAKQIRDEHPKLIELFGEIGSNAGRRRRVASQVAQCFIDVAPEHLELMFKNPDDLTMLVGYVHEGGSNDFVDQFGGESSRAKVVFKQKMQDTWTQIPKIAMRLNLI